MPWTGDRPRDVPAVEMTINALDGGPAGPDVRAGEMTLEALDGGKQAE